MNRFLSLIIVAGLAFALAGCKSGGKSTETAAARTEAVPASETATAAAPQAAKPEAAAAPAVPAAAAEAAKPADKAAEAAEEAPDDPDDEGWGDGKGAGIDRDKLAKAYEAVYCAQKKGEMDKILDIYKANGFEKPEDFVSTWVEAARDTTWVTRVATDAASKCK